MVAVVEVERIGGEERCLIAGGGFEGGAEARIWESSITKKVLANRKTPKTKKQRDRER